MLDAHDTQVIEEAKARRAEEAQARQDRIDELNKDANAFFDERKAAKQKQISDAETERGQKIENQLRAEAKRAFLKNPMSNEQMFDEWFDHKGGKEALLAEKERIALEHAKRDYRNWF